MSNEKDMIIHSIVGLMKIYPNIKISQYFPKPYETFDGYINAKVDLYNYAKKKNLKNAIGVDTSTLAAKSGLAKNWVSLKAKIDGDKLKAAPVDLSKLSSVVNNDVANEIVHDKLVAKVNNIDTIGFLLKPKYDTDNSELEKKISDADKKIRDTS